MEASANGVWIRRLTCWSSGAVRTGISQGPTQTAAIMQPSKSYYHCNGTDGVGGEKIGVWEGVRDEVEGCSFLLSPSPCLKKNVCVCLCVCTHIFLYLIATVTESSEVTPPCQINASLKKKNAWRSGDFWLKTSFRTQIGASQQKPERGQEMYNIKTSMRYGSNSWRLR